MGEDTQGGYPRPRFGSAKVLRQARPGPSHAAGTRVAGEAGARGSRRVSTRGTFGTELTGSEAALRQLCGHGGRAWPVHLWPPPVGRIGTEAEGQLGEGAGVPGHITDQRRPPNGRDWPPSGHSISGEGRSLPYTSS